METRKNIAYDLEQITNGKISIKKDIAHLYKALTLILTGAIMVFTSESIEDHSSTSYMLLLTLGLILIVIGVILFFTGKKRMIYEPSGSRTILESRYYDPVFRETLLQYLISGEWSNTLPLNTDNSGIRLDIVRASDNRFAAAQLFHYVPYCYEPFSEVFCFYEENAEKFCNKIRKTPSL